jgi:hypothetical protein
MFLGATAAAFSVYAALADAHHDQALDELRDELDAVACRGCHR